MGTITKTFERDCVALREKEISFSEWYERTRGNWLRIAKDLRRRWPCPPSVSEEDVAQELVLAAWDLVPVWDPEYRTKDGEVRKSFTLGRFLVWRACDRAKKWMHRQRGAEPNDRSRGRYEIAFSSLATASDEGELPLRVQRLLEEQATDATQEAEYQRRENFRTRLAHIDADEDLVAAAAVVVARGDLPRAAALLYSNPTTRRIARLVSERDAERRVRRAAELLPEACLWRRRRSEA